MKKLIIFFLSVGLVLMLSLSPVAAFETEESGEEVENIGVTIEITQPEDTTLTPESPFYFIKRFIEDVRMLLMFDQEKKVALLDELAEERANELEILEAMYAEGELSEEQLITLEKALDDLLLYTENLVNELVKLEEPDGEQDEDGEDELIEEGTENEQELDKYQWRIAHLESIAERAPEAAQNGLARAIANAERQRERAIAKGKILGNDTENDDAEGDETSDDDDVDFDEEATNDDEKIDDPNNDVTLSSHGENNDQGANEEKENGKLKKPKAPKNEGPPAWANANNKNNKGNGKKK